MTTEPLEQCYRIADLVSAWGIKKDAVRRLVKDEPGVMKLRLGKKKASTTYMVPASVVERIRMRLVNG